MKIALNEWNKWYKRFLAFASDLTVTVLAWLFAAWLASGKIAHSAETHYAIIFSVVALQGGLFYILCGLYRGVWRFASIPDLVRIVRAVVLGTFTIYMAFKLSGIQFSEKVYIIYSLVLILMLAGSRLVFRLISDYQKGQGKKILIVGAGNAADAIIRYLKRGTSIQHYSPCIMVDDDPSRLGLELQGIRVVGTCDDIPHLIDQYKISLIIIAIPSASSKKMQRIVSICEETQVPIKTLPGLKSLTNGNVTLDLLREVSLEDLLGREEIHIDWPTIKDVIKDKTVLVTGGGGSIGSELCRQISNLNPKKLIVIDNCEFNLYSIDLELNAKSSLNYQIHLCDVTNRLGIENIFNNHKPDLVFHVAAYKHVPMLETHIRSAMFNNIIGTKIIAETTEKFKAHSFVLISSDKAVNPVNIMGATKRAAEIFCQNFNLSSKTRFITVRFGNVLDSAGSVIPLFRKQLLAGGPLTVTDKNMSRYFMTIPEASQLILQAVATSTESGIFMLDMGEPVNINYLAEQMIKLAGKKLDQDIQIHYTGLRPGEKLHEELFHEKESIMDTPHPKIKQAKPRPIEWQKIKNTVHAIEQACEREDDNQLKTLLSEMVPEYVSKTSIINKNIEEVCE